MSLNKFSAINKIMTPYLDFLENKKRFIKLKDFFDEEVFQEISDMLDNVNLDHTTFIKTLKHTVNTGTINTVISQDLVTNNDSSTEESDVEEITSEKKEEKPKTKHNVYSKRLQFNKKEEVNKEEVNKKEVKRSKRIL